MTMTLAAAVLAGCQKDPGQSAAQPAKVTIDPVITRVTEVNFEDNDRIGLTIVRDDEQVHVENRLMTFGEGVFSGDLMWYSEGTVASTLTAYYPYNEAGVPATFSVAADQTTAYAASDLIAAHKTGVLPSAAAVSMDFKHLLSKLVINVTNESGSDIEAVTLKGAVPSATIDLAALTAVADGGAAADIRAQEVTANTAYRAIIVPQTVAFTLAVTTGAGKTLTQELASVTLRQGGQYSVDVRVLAEGLKVTMSGEIENWEDNGPIGPAEDEVPFEEFDGYFMYDGERYNTVTLANGTTWMAEPLRYLPEGFTPSEDPTVDSHIWYPYETVNEGEPSSWTINASGTKALTDAESIRKFGYLYDIYSVFGREASEENLSSFEGEQGICPKGWHVPTRTEFWNLCGLSNKAAEGESGNQINENALFYDQTYGGGKMSLFDAAGWNYVKSGARMWKVNNGVTSTSYQATQLYSANHSLGEEHYGELALTYIMSSTPYKQLTSGDVVYYQFFAMMTTFTKVYPEGRINVAYIPTYAGQQVRCVKDSE